MNQRFRAVLKSAAAYLATAAFIAGLVYFMLQLFDQRDMLREITPDIGMTKHCTQDTAGTMHCTQVPFVPNAPPAPRDPDAPLYVTVEVAE